MFELYLGALIFGGGLLSLSLLFGGDSDSADADVHTDAHFDADVDADVDAGIDVEADVSTDMEADTNTHIAHGSSDTSVGLSAVAEFFSLRNGLFFLAFFGLTGVVFTLLDYGSMMTLAYSLVAGTGSAFMGFKLMRYLRGSETGQALHLAETTGRTGTVVVGISRSAKGKIRILNAGSSTTMLAAVHDTAAADQFAVGEKVVVVRVIQNVAWVVESD